MGGRVASEREEAGDDERGRTRSSRSPEQLASLTPLRGMAALWVVIFLFAGISRLFTPSATSAAR
jgi:hypothetical protein